MQIEESHVALHFPCMESHRHLPRPGYMRCKVTNSGLVWVCACALWHVGHSHRIVAQ